MIPKKCLMFMVWVIFQLCAFAQEDIPSGKTVPNKSLSKES